MKKLKVLTNREIEDELHMVEQYYFDRIERLQNKTNWLFGLGLLLSVLHLVEDVYFVGAITMFAIGLYGIYRMIDGLNKW